MSLICALEPFVLEIRLYQQDRCVFVVTANQPTCRKKYLFVLLFPRSTAFGRW